MMDVIESITRSIVGPQQQQTNKQTHKHAEKHEHTKNIKKQKKKKKKKEQTLLYIDNINSITIKWKK